MVRKYLEQNYGSILKKVKAITREHELTEDLLNDCIVSFLEKGNDYTTQVLYDGKIDHYLIRMCHIQFNSQTSPFYVKYRKLGRETITYSDISGSKSDYYEWEYNNEDDKELKVDKQKMASDIKLYIGKLPIDKKAYAEKHFIEGKSQREISRMYNINRIHISRDIQTVQNNIKLTFNKKNYESE